MSDPGNSNLVKKDPVGYAEVVEISAKAAGLSVILIGIIGFTISHIHYSTIHVIAESIFDPRYVFTGSFFVAYNAAILAGLFYLFWSIKWISYRFRDDIRIDGKMATWPLILRQVFFFGMAYVMLLMYFFDAIKTATGASSSIQCAKTLYIEDGSYSYLIWFSVLSIVAGFSYYQWRRSGFGSGLHYNCIYIGGLCFLVLLLYANLIYPKIDQVFCGGKPQECSIYVSDEIAPYLEASGYDPSSSNRFTVIILHEESDYLYVKSKSGDGKSIKVKSEHIKWMHYVK